MAHTGDERIVPGAEEHGIRWDHARRIRRAGLLCLVFCIQATGSILSAQAGMGPDTTAGSRSMPATGPLPSVAPEERLPSDEELAAQGAVIGEIVIRNENIFDVADPRENNWLFRLANKLHVKTRPWLIRKQLLFRTGDPYDRRVLDESERILRSNRYFYDARIRPVAFHRGRVDVEVLTRDVWTLNPGVSFKRQGGANTTSINFSEYNLFGTGVGINLSRASTPERNTSSVQLD